MLSLILLGSLLSSSLAVPDAATATGGFQPLPLARGVPQGKVLSTTKTKKAISDDNVGAAGTFAEQTYGAPFGGGHGAGPTKTIYVNVPPEQYPIPKPIAAGPPRKHYRIVFIRSPSPPPPQPIIPPRVEQKTLIYVLHPRQQAQGHNIVEVPDVKHDPQVYFIQYDDEPPTAEDLQDLVKNTIDNHGAGGFNYGAPGLAVASSSSSGIFPAASSPSYDNIHSGNEISIQTQKKLPQGLQQALYNNALNSQLIRAKPEALDSSKISPFPQPQKEKLARTRQTTSESKTKIKSTQPSKTSPRIAEFLNKRQTPETPVHFKRFTRNPEDALKTEFRESFAKPFRFGAKTSKEAKKQEAPAANQAKAQSS